MLLRDRVDVVLQAATATVVRSDVPAHFGAGATMRTIDRGVIYTEQVQAIVSAEDGALLDPELHALVHRGKVWVLDGWPIERMRGPVVHHYTVRLIRVGDIG